VLVDNVRIDVAKMMAQKATAVSGLTKGIEGLFKKNKVTYVKGAGALSATRGEVVVTAADGTTSTLTAKNVLLATGSEARGRLPRARACVHAPGTLRCKRSARKTLTSALRCAGARSCRCRVSPSTRSASSPPPARWS
jgi:glycine/D-amino acid oxidase-like deaminating enzyme